MYSASIKLSNLQYIEALEQLALNNLINLIARPKLVMLPFYNFICRFVDVLTQYCKSGQSDEESDYQANSFNCFLVDYYVRDSVKLIKFRKYDNNLTQIYRQLFSFLRSWKKYTQHHEQAKLFLSLLTPDRNSKQIIRQFLKYRKCILKTLNHKILQQITITHQDALTITHTLYPRNGELKSFVTRKINQMFISLKRKLINSAKQSINIIQPFRINGAVMCEIFMACVQKYEQQNEQSGYEDINKNKIIKNITKHNENNKIQKFHHLSYLNPEKIQQKQKISKIKYNLSFSQQYASYYQPQIQSNPLQCNKNHLQQSQQILYEPLQEQSKSQRYLNGNSSQWRIHNSELQESPMLQIKNSSTLLGKDMEIDQKIKTKRFYKYLFGDERHEYYMQNMYNEFNNEPYGKQNVKYPKGWDKFIRTNEETKRKIMNKALSQDDSSRDYFS